MENASAGAPGSAGHINNLRANELVHPQTLSSVNWFCIEIFVRQFFHCIAIIDALEVNNPTILLWANCCNGQGALCATFNNDEFRTDRTALF
jgi:hypothetical protein